MTPDTKKKIAQLIFEQCGTSQQPTEDRHSVLKIFSSYFEACEKNAFMKSVQDFFHKNPHVETVSLEGNDEYDDEGGTYFSSYCSEVCLTQEYQDANPETYDDEAEGLQEAVSDYDIEYNLLSNDLMKDLTPLELSLASMEELKQKVFTASELEIFSMVENYEKNLLEENIAPKIKSTSKPKMKV